jgi:hypothetical protein
MKKTDFDASLEATHKYKGYKNHFKGLYMALKVAGAILLTISAFLSSRFFGAILEPYLFEASSYAGFIISLLISGLIGKLTGDLLVYWEEHGMAEPTLAGLLILLVAGNAYFDWKGGNEWAYELSGERPVNAQAEGIASAYSPQIAGIDAEILALESANFYWCNVHPSFGEWKTRAHICNAPTNKRHVNTSVKGDLQAVAKIEELKAQKLSLQSDMSAQLTAASNAHTASLSEYDDRLSGTKTVTKGGSIACMLLYSFVAFWCHKYGVRAVKEMESPSPTLEMTQAEELLALEAKTNRELREELASLKEAIAEGRNMNEPKLADIEAKK